jgi:hypothetical protein
VHVFCCLCEVLKILKFFWNFENILKSWKMFGSFKLWKGYKRKRVKTNSNPSLHLSLVFQPATKEGRRPSSLPFRPKRPSSPRSPVFPSSLLRSLATGSRTSALPLISCRSPPLLCLASKPPPAASFSRVARPPLLQSSPIKEQWSTDTTNAFNSLILSFVSYPL